MTNGRGLDSHVVEQAIARVAGVESLDRGDSLFEDGLDLDSLGFLTLMLELETVSGTELKTGLSEEALDSVGQFVDYVTTTTRD